MIKMAINTLNKITQENAIFYDRTLLKRLTGSLHFAKYGQKRNISKHNGTEIDMRRFNSLAPAMTPLTEGVKPEGTEFTVTNVRATVKQYGAYVPVTDMLDLAGLDPVITEIAEVLGEQAAETIDNIIKEEIFAGTNVQYAGGVAGRDSVTAVLTGDEVMKAVRTLRANKAKPVADGYYIGFIDPHCAYDLMKDPLWQDVSKYSNKDNIEKGEIGKLHGVRFIDNTNAFVAGNVHGTLIIGQDAYGIVDIEGSRKPQIIIKRAEDSGTDQPLNQESTVGWKVLFTAKRLQELAMVRIESGVTA